MGALLNQLRLIEIDFLDVLEIAVVAYLIYRILILWSGTRAFQILFGLVLVITIYGLAGAFGLNLIESLFAQAFTYAAFLLIVVFQPELRLALARIGRNRVFRAITGLEERGAALADELIRSTALLSERGFGAIIAVEQDLSLDEYVDNQGTPLRADLSAELVAAIFAPQSPVHDGSVIIRDGQIMAAGVYLPMTQHPLEDRNLGTRHRAAVGLSEETDALVLVVSEETKQVSLARRGVLRRGVNPDDLRERLVPANPEGAGGPAVSDS